jgi:hypothetical protein
MGDFLFGADEPEKDDSLEKLVQQQTAETGRLRAEQTAKEDEEQAQRRLGRRGRKSLQAATNMGAGFFRSIE